MSRKLTALLLAILMLPFSAMNVVAVGEPDLWINEISFSDDSPTGGDTVTITAEVANDGGDSGVVSVTANVTFSLSYSDDIKWVSVRYRKCSSEQIRVVLVILLL